MITRNNISFIGFLLLTLAAGIWVNFPFLNFQNFLAVGDHGRDLYAAQAVLRGELPYQDFWWVYGPLMPYYYGAFFKFFGMHIPSVLLGKMVCNIAAGVFFFLALERWMMPLAAFAGAFWLIVFHQDFFFTYNHAGGIAIMLAAIWMHAAFIKTSRIHDAFTALVIIFILGLIKINFAVTTLFITVLLVFIRFRTNGLKITVWEKLFYTSAFVLLPLLWYLTYDFFLHGLTIAEIRQCLPYLGGDEPYNHLGPLQTIPQLVSIIFFNIRSSWVSLALCGLILVSLMKIVLGLVRNRNVNLLMLLGYAGLFYALNLHEFIKSGVFYRMIWAQPLGMLLTFVIISSALETLSKPIKILLYMLLILIAGMSAWQTTALINAYKTPAHYLGSDRGQVYLANDRDWMQTVVLTTKTLNTVLKKDDLFLALPYDCLYYYLTDKPSPTRQLIFFDHIKVSLEQEQRIIAELEKNKIAMVLVSSRQSAREPGLGTLGVTYCPMISQYINTNFTAYAKIGDWTNEPGWAWNHGTYLLKRGTAAHE